MDDFERAAMHEQTEREILEKQHMQRARPEPRDDCDDCGEPLEQHRKQYGTCVYCQTARETRAKHYRHD